MMNQEHERRTRLRRSVHGNSLVPDVVGRYATYQEVHNYSAFSSVLFLLETCYTVYLWTSFFQIMDWLRKQAEINNDIMELHTIGKTYEKRELIVVKVYHFLKKISLCYRKPSA